MRTNLLVTGANGFVGKALCERALTNCLRVKGAVRSSASIANLPTDVEPAVVGAIGPDTNWSTVLNAIDTVVHLAARVHVMKEDHPEPLKAFRHVNVGGTACLARAAAEMGVQRFIFLSSVGVNGNKTNTRAFSEEDKADPHNDYSLSKLEAEQILMHIAEKYAMEVVIIRAPLIYGPGNPGNFLRLLALVKNNPPLPLSLVNNHRSLIYLGNLVDAIITCLDHPKASGRIYLVSDGEDISTPELIRRIASAFGHTARQFPFPPFLIRLAGKLAGKSDTVARLFDSLVVNSSKIRNELGWKPPYTMEQGLKETVEWFNNTGCRH